ncbi:Hypothetical Protein FCC1311_072822 [Hondaea fermentalgiana]|uniref:PH domain-containing protein n=1 Tax=Hondaea fermentalgiana TaxID=2315210 RepID=A0A2R5GRU4_9STRA|nr:Hypothetical Protein FCC1311_072822 [Hondaea fermentalgiana]|eukprot:GBG31061.1 Hypothetical Protein FCC1311_072822 [Hondaea fermentalgiana]
MFHALSASFGLASPASAGDDEGENGRGAREPEAFSAARRDDGDDEKEEASGRGEQVAEAGIMTESKTNHGDPAGRGGATNAGPKTSRNRPRGFEDKENAVFASNSAYARERTDSSGELRLVAEVARLKRELETAQHEAKLAAEIGQELLKQEQATREENRALDESLEAQRGQLTALHAELEAARKEAHTSQEALEEYRGECKALEERATGLAQKLETVNREALRDGASFAKLEAQIRELMDERDAAKLRAEALELERSRAELVSPVVPSPSPPTTVRKNLGASLGEIAVLSLSPGTGNFRKTARQNSESTGQIVRIGSISSSSAGSRRPHGRKEDNHVEAEAEAEANSDSEYEQDYDSDGTFSESEVPFDDSEESFKTPTHRQRGNVSRLRATLSAARAENARSKQKIRTLEKALQQNALETQQSARKVTSLEQDLSEFQQIIEARSEMHNAAIHEEMETGIGDGDCEGISSLEAAILRDELERMKEELRQANVLAIIRGEDLETTIEELREVQSRREQEHALAQAQARTQAQAQAQTQASTGVGLTVDVNLGDENGTSSAEPSTGSLLDSCKSPGVFSISSGTDPVTSPSDVVKVKRRRRKGAYTTVDASCGPNKPIDVGIVELNKDAHGSGRELIVSRPPLDQHAGQLLVKQFRRRNIVISASRSWKARVVQLRGPVLLLFRNEWDRKPCGKVPLDGTEVRVVRRPHLTGSTGVVSGSPRQKHHAKHTTDAQAARAAAIAQNSCIVHEFHIWHPRRPAVLFSADSHVEMSRWAEAIRQNCGNVSMRPKRFAAGFLTVMEGLGQAATKSSLHLKRYFAVLRTDGIHLYTHPRKHKSLRVILLEDSVRAWKPTLEHKAAKVFPDIQRAICISSRETGECCLLADTSVDCDWWISTIRAHVLGIVSRGSVEGMRGDIAFGCVEV